eukprot:526764-Alexandrium_andersonii.AAC.1
MTIAYPASGGSGGAVVGGLGQVRACCPWCTTEGGGPHGTTVALKVSLRPYRTTRAHVRGPDGP